MKVKLISKGKKKAEVIVVQDTQYGKVYSTRHLLLKNYKWVDKKGNIYKI